MQSTKHKKVKQLDINAKFISHPSQQEHSYILVDKRFLHLGDRVDFSLYFHDSPTHLSLFLQSDTVLDRKQKQKLQQIEQLYVPAKSRNQYEDFVEDHLQSILKNDSFTLDEKTDIIYTATTDLTHSLYDNPEALENAKHSKKIVTPILESIIYNKDTIASYIKIIEYDYYTHTHSLNVSIYALCLGAALDLSKGDLTALGRAALLHDLGKSKINYDVVNKEGPLSNREFNLMKKHPALGHDIALSIGIEDKNILDGIRHHHEKLNGMGYPDGLKGQEITMFARIIGVCDVFDALTTRRSYKEAMTSYDALYLMKTEMSTHLDLRLINLFIKTLHE